MPTTNDDREMSLANKIPDNYLDRDVFLDVCKDGTISYRRRALKEPRLHNAALPVFTVDTVDEAIAMQVRFGSKQEGPHPKQRDRVWYKLSWPAWRGNLDQLDDVTIGMARFWEDVITRKKIAPDPGSRWRHRRDKRVVTFERLDFEPADEKEGPWTLRVRAFAVYAYVATAGRTNPGRLRGRSSTTRSATPSQRMPFDEWRKLFSTPDVTASTDDAAPLTERKVWAIVEVLTVNRDSADLMIKRGVDPMDVRDIANLACKWIASGRQR